MSESPVNKPKILGIGDAFVDLLTYASEIPCRGGNVWGTAAALSPGGTTANVAADIAKLGLRSVFIGCVGDDPYGYYTIEEFQKVGVDTHGISIHAKAYTGIVLSIIDDTGERTFIACGKGASHSQLSEQDLAEIEFKDFPYVHSTGVCLVEEQSRSVLLSALKKSHEAGAQVFFDPNIRLDGSDFPHSYRESLLQAFTVSDVILAGDNELDLLYPGLTWLEAAREIRRDSPKVVVVKQGENGAAVVSDMGVDLFPAFEVKVDSTIGAGDAFDAGFIAARVRGADLHDGLVYATAVAGMKVTRSSARSVPTHAEVLHFLRERGHTLYLNE